MSQGINFNNQKGVAALEFAIVLPVIITLVYGIIEFGIVMYNKAVITNASREGARAGIVHDEDALSGQEPYTDANITAVVEKYVKWDGSDSTLINLGAPETKPTVSVSPAQGARTARATPLAVTVTYPYNFMLMPGFIPGIPNVLNLSATTTMRRE